MKKMIKNLMLVAVAAMAFVGCQNDNDEVNVTAKKVVLEFAAGFDEDDTRATFGDKVGEAYPTVWEENDYVRVTISDGGENSFTASGSVELPEGEKTAKTAVIKVEFSLEEDQSLPEKGTITATVGSFDYYTGEVSISTYQSPTEKSVERMSLIATREYTNGDITGEALQFAHAAAYGKMTLSQFADDAADIESVKITIDEGEAINVTPNNGDTKLANPVIWFSTYEDTEIETMTIEATVGGVIYTKTITPAADALKFTTGHVSAFEVTALTEKPADYTLTMTKITSIEGNVVTFANDSGEDLTIEFNPGLTSISAGHYDGVNPDWFQGGIYPWTSETALEYKGDSILTHIAGVDGDRYANDKNGFDISVENVDGIDIYTINAKFGIYIDGQKELEFTYVGAWEAVKSTNCVVKGGCNNSTMFELWFADSQSDMDNDEYVYLYLRVPTSVYSVIPAGTYTYQDATEGDFIINEWSLVKYNSSNYDIKSATLTVSHTETGYIFDATITDNTDKEFNYYYEGAIDSMNSWSLINNPPIPYKDITVEAEMATVTASYSEGYALDYGDSYALYITTAEVDDVAYNLTLNLRIPVGESSNGLIPENTYILDAVDYTLTSESSGDSEKFVNAQLVVEHTATGYNLEFTGENVMKTKFNLTYEDKIAKATANNEFRNPGEKAKLERPNVSAEFNSTTEQVDVSWSSVDNADHYEVSVNEAEAVSVNGTTYSFDADYGTYYDITVVAVPAVDSTLYTNSDAGSTDITTPKDFSADGDYNVTLTKITNIEGNKYTFKGENDKDRLILAFNSGISTFEAGRYELVWGDWGSSDKYIDGNNSNFNFNGSSQAGDYYVSGAFGDEIVEITINDGVYTMVAMLDCGGELVKYTYTGAWEIAKEDLAPIYLNTISEGVEVSNYRQFTMSDGGNNSIKITLLGDDAVSSQYSITSGIYSYLNSLYLSTTQFAVATCIINSAEVKSNISAGTMTVASEGENYTITFDLTIDGNSQPIVVNATLAAPKYLTQPNITDALSTASDTISVAWDDVANAKSYYVTCGDKSQTVTTTTATFTGLTAGTQYTVTVVAKANGYVDSPAATTTVTTLADAGGEGGEGGESEAKQVSLTFFTDNGTSYIFKGDDGHNYLIAFRNYNPGTFSLTDANKFIVTGCTWTANNSTYFGGTQFAEGDTLELIKIDDTSYKIIIRATVDGVPVVATCASTSFS